MREDSFSNEINANTSFNTELFKFGVGVIYQHIVHRDYYIIHVNGAPEQAVALGSSGYIGTSGSNSYEIGSKVLYLTHPDLPCAYIIAQWPDHFPGQITCSRKARLLKEFPNEDDPTYRPERADQGDHEIVGGPIISHGQSARDFKKSTALGGLLSLGLEGLVARANQSCGLEASDTVTHLFGEQLFIDSFTSSLKEFRNKYGQDAARHVFKYVHECLGYSETGELSQVNNIELENPYSNDIRYRDPIPTVSFYEGDSADGQTRMVRVYKEEDEDYSDEELEIEDIKQHKMIPVFKEVLYKDGSYRLQSATEISIEKFSLINDPATRRLNPSEYEDEGGYQGEMNFDYPGNVTYSPMASLGLCYHAFLFENLNFKKYEDRWNRRSSSEVKDLLEGMESALFNKSDFRQLPDIAEILVDREKNITRKIYGSRSGLYFQDDGTVILESGWGSQLVLGPDITFTSARDIINRPGCDLVAVVPGEISLVGKKAINMSADDGSVSVSAKDYINVRQTNEVEGGVFIEVKNAVDTVSEEFPERPVGLVLRSAGLSSVISPRMHENTQTKLVSGEVIDFTLTGNSSFNIRSNSLSYFRHAINQDDGVDLTPDDTPVLFIQNGDVLCRGSATFRGNFNILGDSTCIIKPALVLGSSVTSRSSATFTNVTEDNSQDRIDNLAETVENAESRFDERLDTLIELDNSLIESRYEPFLVEGYGNPQILSSLEFAVATVRKTPFEFFEARWQQYLTSNDTWQWDSQEDQRGSPEILTNKLKLHILDNQDSYVSNIGVFQDEAELPTPSDLVEEEDIEGNYKVSTGQEDYKNSIYDES